METLSAKKLYTKFTANNQLAINSNQGIKENSYPKNSQVNSHLQVSSNQPNLQQQQQQQQNKKEENLKSYFNLKESQNQELLIDQYLTDVYKSKFVNEKKVKNCPPEKEELKTHFSEFRINENSTDPLTYFEKLSQQVLSKTTHCGSPLMIGHMSTSLPYFQRPLAKMLTGLNQNTVKVETSSYLTFLERETLSKLHHAFYKFDKNFYLNNVHNPETSLGTFTSGGTLANLTALWVARNLKLPKSDGHFGGVEKEGLFRALKFYGYSDICFIGSEMVHYSFKKAADILGMGTQGLVTIPSDENYCMKVDLLDEKLKELREKKVCVIAVIGIAGATETGSIDNLKGIANVCKKYDVHFHVDGAWGGPMIFSSTHGQKLKGIELADSITVDAHKQLYTPVGCGVVLFKDPKSAIAIRKTANYIIRLDSMDLGKYSPEGSRPANVVYLHASLSILGTKGLEKAMNHGCEMVDHMKKSIKNHNEFEVLFEPMMNILLYRWIPLEYREKIRKANKPSHLVLTKEDNEVINERNCFLQKLLAHQGESFVSRTTVNSVKYNNTPISCLRVVITNPLTETKHIDHALQEQLRFIKEIETKPRKF